MKSFLEPVERSHLISRHRREKDRRTADRIKAILLSDHGWTFKDIAEALLLDEETVSRHINEYLENEKLSIQTGGSASKLNPQQSSELLEHLVQKIYLKVAEICAHVQNTYGYSYTVSGMRSWLKDHGFSYKQPKGMPSKADPVRQEKFISHYHMIMTTTPEDEPILFVDGVHPTMATKITYGWIRRGTDQVISTTASRTRMNLLGALNLETMTATVESYETLDSNAMEKYFDLLRAVYPNAPKIHLILDRGPYNRSKQTIEAAQKRGIILHHLPPYSPNLNPIERLWKVMNEFVRNNRFFKNAKIFREDIIRFFTETWPNIGPSMVDRINDNFQKLKSSV